MGWAGDDGDDVVDLADHVVIPLTPGPLVALGGATSQRGRDDLDDLIDELFPDVDERPGWFDAALLVAGSGLAAWHLVGGGPTFALVTGLALVAIGCVLPVRATWRSVGGRRQRRQRAALLASGRALDAGAPETARLVAAYRRVVADAATTDHAVPAVAAAHAALLDVASLLDGRRPASPSERAYVSSRADAIDALASALRQLPPAGAVPPDAVLQAREELDALTASSSVTRLEDLTSEIEAQADGPR